MSASGLKLKPVALAVAFAFPAMAFASAGRVDFAVGEVKALAPDGRARPLAKGDEFNSGDTIATGGDGRVWLRFTDGAQVSLQPQSEYRIDNYKYEGKTDGEERGFFSLLKGGLRTITGWVGRTNKKNYGVNTAVATIGIRGTEYSITYGNSITVSTGEGSTEICNAAGCITLVGGQTGYVAGSNIKPVIINTKAELPPPPPLPGPQFAVGNDVTASGGSALITGTVVAPLLSGPGYAMAWASPTPLGMPSYLLESAGTAAFNGSSGLTAYSGSSNTYSPTGLTDVGTDGVVGWGRWTSGTAYVVGYSGTMSNVAYVVGMPTPAADMSALSGQSVTATYAKIGGTAPTDNAGHVGTLNSASLTANFGPGTVSGSLNVTVNGTNYAPTWSGSITGAKFSGSLIGAYSAIFEGSFIGPSASRAGMVYLISGASTISGAVAFSR